MKIDLSSIDTERFRLKEKDGLTLITPESAMWDWRDDELHMRSLLCRDDGEVISAGFPKFFNYGERPNHPQIWNECGYRYSSQKEDGTLIIASLINGDLHLRTRGNHDLGDFHDKVWKLVGWKTRLNFEIPKVILGLAKQFNCKLHQISILMEYVSPDNLIVVKYNEDELFVLAVTIYTDDKLVIASNSIVTPYMSSCKFPLVRDMPFDLSGEDFAWKVAESSSNTEGFVVRCYQTNANRIIEHLIKFKTDWYVRLHGLMTETESRIDEMLFHERIFTEKRFREYFMGLGYDWETCSHILDNKGARAKMDAMKWRLELVKSTLTVAKNMKKNIDSGQCSRKDIAFWLKQNLPKESHGIVFGYLDGKHEMPALAHIAGVSAAALRNQKDIPPLDMLLNYE